MNYPYLLFPLIAAVCPAAPEQETGTVEKFEQARLEYEALRALLHIKAAMADKQDAQLPPVDKVLFLNGFRTQLSSGGDFPFKSLTEHSRKRTRHVEAQIRKADQMFSLIEDGDKIAVGLSGGKDSSLLLYAMYLYHFLFENTCGVFP